MLVLDCLAPSDAFLAGCGKRQNRDYGPKYTARPDMPVRDVQFRGIRQPSVIDRVLPCGRIGHEKADRAISPRQRANACIAPPAQLKCGVWINEEQCQKLSSL